MRKYCGKDVSRTVLPATNLGPKPGDFPVGSAESRAAARAMCDRKQSTCEKIIVTVEHIGSDRPPDIIECMSGLALGYSQNGAKRNEQS